MHTREPPVLTMQTHLQYVEGPPHVSAPQPYQCIHAASPQLHPTQADTQQHTRGKLMGAESRAVPSAQNDTQPDLAALRAHAHAGHEPQ